MVKLKKEKKLLSSIYLFVVVDIFNNWHRVQCSDNSSLRGQQVRMPTCNILWICTKMGTNNMLAFAFFSVISVASGLYFHIGETEKKCFIEEIPDETMVVGTFCKLRTYTLSLGVKIWYFYISEGFMQNNSMRISPVGHAFHEYAQNTKCYSEAKSWKRCMLLILILSKDSMKF